MPRPLTYPGVYIEEVPSGVRTITGVATSITAFVGRARQGPVDTPVRVQSFTEYVRIFGGLWSASPMSQAVGHFFQHGGSDAIIVRIFNGNVTASTATITLATATGNLVLEASSPGTWGASLRATVNHLTRAPLDTTLFNLIIEQLDADGQVVSSEQFRNVSATGTDPRFVNNVLAEQSSFVRVRTSAPDGESPNDATQTAVGNTTDDGNVILDSQIATTPPPGTRIGVYALDSVDLFNLLCIPPLSPTTDVAAATWAAAATYCRDRRAMLVIDPPAAWTASPSTAVSSAETGVNGLRGTVGNDNGRHDDNKENEFGFQRHPTSPEKGNGPARIGADSLRSTK